MPSTLLYVRPTNVEHSFPHPSPSTTSFLVALRCWSVHDSLPFLRNIAWIGSTHTPSFTPVLCCPSLPIDHPGLFRKHLLYILRADHYHIHRHLSFEHEDVNKVCNCGHLTKITSRALQVPSPVSTFALRKICFLHAMCCYLLHLPIHTPSASKGRGPNPPLPPNYSSTRREMTTTTLSCLLLPSASSV